MRESSEKWQHDRLVMRLEREELALRKELKVAVARVGELMEECEALRGESRDMRRISSMRISELEALVGEQKQQRGVRCLD